MAPARTIALPRVLAALSAAAILAAGAGCGGKVGQFVWADEYRDLPGTGVGYSIRPGDLLNVRVWNQESASSAARVRPDGMISLPLVNDVPAAGIEPTALAATIQTKLQEFINNPNVTVSVEEYAPTEVSVLGEVARPGVYRVAGDATILNALALAGGLTQLASPDKIFVIRYDDPQAPTRIRFTYQALTRVEGSAAGFRLRPRDVLVVE